jgi:quinol monooxygenase YgiN
MSDENVRVLARVIALPDKIEEVKAIAIALLEPTRAESGCIYYDLLQGCEDPTDFTFVEEWKGIEALNAHLQSEHVRQALEQINGLVAAGPDIRRYNLINN